MTEEAGKGYSRRAFLGIAAGAGASAVIGGIGGGLLVAGTRLAEEPAQPAAQTGTTVAFEGANQAGIARPGVPQPNAVIASFDVVAASRAGLEVALQELTRRSRLLSAGWSPEAGDPLYPPEESGILGAATGPADLTVTVAVGASLFDDRFGLAGAIPRQLVEMTPFPNDRLDPGHSHGDVLIQVCATDEFATVHALRYLMTGTRDTLRLRWMVNGFHRPNATPTPGHTTTRNLMGFKDGTANPNPDDADLMDQLVWIGRGDDEPSWAVGGSYMVVRLIRMFVERWDRTALLEQEKIIGRTKRTGAPLGQIARRTFRPTTAIPMALASRSMPISGRRTRGQPAHNAPGSSGAATHTAAASMTQACSTRVSCSSASSATSRQALSPSRSGSQASRSRSTSSRSAAATSLRYRGSRRPTASSAKASCAPDLPPASYGSTRTRIHSRVPFGANAMTEIDDSLFGSGSIATA